VDVPRGARPVKDQLKIEHGDLCSATSFDRFLVKSLGQAAKRFEEHYIGD